MFYVSHKAGQIRYSLLQKVCEWNPVSELWKDLGFLFTCKSRDSFVIPPPEEKQKIHLDCTLWHGSLTLCYQSWMIPRCLILRTAGRMRSQHLGLGFPRSAVGWEQHRAGLWGWAVPHLQDQPCGTHGCSPKPFTHSCKAPQSTYPRNQMLR